MDLDKYLKTVTNINEYISFTRDVENKRIDLAITFNMSTVLSLKSIRSMEIEYFNKCDENGGATIIFELLLRFPPTKIWSLVGKELVCILQYWMEAIRKHLIVHNIHWWTFLKLLLKFIKDIHVKDPSMNKVLIEETADCLLDLATHAVPDAAQRWEIVHTFNCFCAESSRNVRLAYKDRLQKYFIKLSSILAAAGDLRLQHGILEALLRWLLPRHHPSVRGEAAARWFDTRTHGKAVQIFLERSWQNFVKDARDFLNAFNETGDLVTSVLCKKLTIGNKIAISAKSKREYWLDVNSATKCISMLLDPKLCEALEVSQSCDALLITEENACKVEMNKLSHEVVITATVLDLTQVCPGAAVANAAADICVTVERCDVARLDRALRAVFEGKYRITFDIENFTSPEDKRESLDVINDTEEESRFSIPTDVRRRKHSGYIVRPRIPGSLNSPSTVSTSSLAQLHEKLAALPRYSYDKEPVSVCAQPQLSSVTEVSESEENHSVNNASLSTIRLRTYGVCRKKNVTAHNSTSRSNSDYSKETCNLSPVVNDNENSVSCLLVATIGSADDSVINDTIERLPKDIPCTTDNIVDLLAQEALQASTKEHFNNTAQAEKKSECPERNFFQIEKYSKSAIEKATVYEYEFAQERNTVNNQPDVDELSNEIVDNTPANITVRKSKQEKCNATNENLNDVEPAVLIHDIQVVEDFFTKHVSENKNGDLVISPTLAKKINETSSECSDDFDSFLVTDNHNFVQDNDVDQLFDIDVIECLNAMVDKVCEDFDKCTKYLDLRAETKADKIKSKKHIKGPKTQNAMNSPQENASQVKEKPKRRILKLKINAKRLSSKKNTKNQNKEDKSRPFKIMSPIIERESVVEEQMTKNPCPATPERLEKPMSLRKRKLYSPKDDLCNVTKVVDVVESSEDNSTSTSEVKVYCKTPKSTATCYKELEKARKRRIRQPRTRKFNTSTVSTPSPRTLKNNQIFDSLKDVVDGEKVTLIDKNKVAEENAVYNCTSESEDENVKNDTKPKPAIAKVSSTAVNSAKTAKKPPRKTRKRSDNTNNSVDISEDNNNNNNTAKRKRLTTRSVSTRSQKEIVSKIPDPEINLEDERLRSEAPEILNTSILIEMPKDMEKPTSKEPEFVLKEKPQLEAIVTDDDIELVEHNDQNVKRYTPITRSKRMLSLKRHVNTTKDNLDTTADDKFDCVITNDDAKIIENNQQNTKYNVRNTKNKKLLSLKRNREIAKDNLGTNNVDNERTVSPLPGLVVETELSERENNDASITEMSENVLRKFKDIYHGKVVAETEANATQNLLSDVDANNDVSIQLNITEELNPEVSKKPKKNISRKRSSSKSDKENENTDKNSRKKLTKKEILKIKQERPSTVTQASEPEVIQLSPPTDVSEKTMATLGNTRSPITGHGDFNEDPPSSTLLNTEIEPREVEQEYLNQSLKDFLSKLNKDANDEASNKSDSKGSSKRKNKSNCLSTKSNSKSPVVSITRLSSEDIRLLTSNCSKPSSGNIEVAKSNSKVSSIQIIPETTTAVIETHKDRTVRTRSKSQAQNTARKSMISPIKLFEDMNDLDKIEPFGSEKDSLENAKTVSSPKICSIPSKAKVNRKQSKVAKKVKKPVKETMVTSSPITSKQTSVTEELNRVDSIISRSSAVLKRKSPLLRSSKRSKLEVNNNVSAALQSCPSFDASSVDEWFKRNEPASGPAESLDLSIKDNIRNVLEKLDTTLVEIHHNTSKRFISMFVDTQKSLKDMMEKRQELYRQTASEILSGVVKIMDEKFSELDRKSKMLDEEFMSLLKENARAVIRKECEQKRAMVTLLREDVQAVLDHAGGGGRH